MGSEMCIRDSVGEGLGSGVAVAVGAGAGGLAVGRTGGGFGAMVEVAIGGAEPVGVGAALGDVGCGVGGCVSWTLAVGALTSGLAVVGLGSVGMVAVVDGAAVGRASLLEAMGGAT